MMLFYLNIISGIEEKTTFELLYNKYKHFMYRIAYNILNDEFLSEDAVHQAFLNIIPHLSKILSNEIETPKTRGYLIVVTRNAAIDLRRQRKKYISLEELESNGQALVAKDDIDIHIEYNDVLERLQSLPEKYRDVLLLKYVYECDNKEIQKILKINAATMRKRIQRARAMLEG